MLVLLHRRRLNGVFLFFSVHVGNVCLSLQTARTATNARPSPDVWVDFRLVVTYLCMDEVTVTSPEWVMLLVELHVRCRAHFPPWSF